MKNIKLDKIDAIPYKNKLILPLPRKLEEIIESDTISFQATLIDNQIVLTSPKIKRTEGLAVVNHTSTKMEVLS